jgi:hypothetical protein
VATTSPDIFGQTDMGALDLATSSVDTSQWPAYTDTSAGFTIQYPKDMVINGDTLGSIVLAAPSADYFHWPLLDDVKITITASSSCPAILPVPFPATSSPIAANGYTFTRTEGGDVAAGNIYRELAYDTVVHGVCYHLDLLDHGSNGAGLYVSDQSLISRYDDQHQADLTNMLGVFIGIVNSFRLVL